MKNSLTEIDKYRCYQWYHIVCTFTEKSNSSNGFAFDFIATSAALRSLFSWVEASTLVQICDFASLSWNYCYSLLQMFQSLRVLVTLDPSWIIHWKTWHFLCHHVVFDVQKNIIIPNVQSLLMLDNPMLEMEYILFQQ